MTLPKCLDMVRSLVEGDAVYLVPFVMTKEASAERFPVLRLMTEAGKRQREQEILNDTALSRQAQQRLLTLMNGHASRMTVDRQNRIVVPAHQLRHIGVDKDVYIFESNGALMAWNPSDWVRYAAVDESEDLSAYLL
jgi:DNA-binding transcriptional regulator/RsmH inhibitor MraZ